MSQPARVSMLLLSSLACASAFPMTPRAQSPTVALDDATFSGVASGPINKFLGIPYAKAPTGGLRFQVTQPIPSYSGNYSATEYGPACIQQAVNIPQSMQDAGDQVVQAVEQVYTAASPTSEDCLSINVIAPSDIAPGTKLPVVVWFHGGSFQVGSSSAVDGSAVVQRSISTNEPVIYVSMNYRLNAFGFLGSLETLAAEVGNLGLRDQREALQWVQNYIHAFGGDASKVTLWGQGAGAVSASLQMLTNGGNTEGLFRGAFMQSGAPVPTGHSSHGQAFYDSIVLQTGCANTTDTLACLRSAPLDALQSAVNNQPSIFAYPSIISAWLPRAEGGIPGTFLMSPPQQLIQDDSVATIPFVIGNTDDEGTIFSFANSNITTDDELHAYLKTYWASNSTDETVNNMTTLYPGDVTQGSPFDTGTQNALTPKYKQLAALQGDALFEGPRRWLLSYRSGKQDMWTYLSKRSKQTPYLGSDQDLLNVFGGGDMVDYLIRFVNNLDPNSATGTQWPKYTTESPSALVFLDGSPSQDIEQDTFRQDAISFLMTFFREHPI
ncbi:Alpha/Beta hydrolase protein [Melanogaster broomeanus]|nr:Alpha/Beta hydrolase protein [Melanogaster broomeanus]